MRRRSCAFEVRFAPTNQRLSMLQNNCLPMISLFLDGFERFPSTPEAGREVAEFGGAAPVMGLKNGETDKISAAATKRCLLAEIEGPLYSICILM